VGSLNQRVVSFDLALKATYVLFNHLDGCSQFFQFSRGPIPPLDERLNQFCKLCPDFTLFFH